MGTSSCGQCGGPVRVGHPCRPVAGSSGVVRSEDVDETVVIIACDVCGTIEERAAA